MSDQDGGVGRGRGLSREALDARGGLHPDFAAAFKALAISHGDLEVLRACLQVVTDYANLGARHALGKRVGDSGIECPRCRERDAVIRQTRENLQRIQAGARPQGGAGTDESKEDR